jgi:Fe-S-cluster containining protein
MNAKLSEISPDTSDERAGHSDVGREEVAAGLRYAHFRADANTGKLLEFASFLYAAIDLLNKKGVLDLAELDEHKKQAAANLVQKFSERGMGVVYQKPEYDKYKFEGAVQIDCEKRIHLCHAACCKLRFALSKQDVEEGIIRWEFAAPYLVARASDGSCQHLDREQKCCTVHAHRPVPCRAFDCRQDKRIWLDFANKVVNPQINEPDWPQTCAVKSESD